MYRTFVVWVMCLTVCVFSRKLPPEINRCSLSDPKLGDCMKINMADALVKLRNGNKDLGVVPLEPLVIPKLAFGNVDSGSSVSIRQEYENLKFYDSTNCTISDVDVNLSDDNCYLKFKVFVPQIRMQADYKMSGKILVLPVNGHGKCNNVFYETAQSYDLKCETYAKKGRKHLRVVDYKLRLLPKRMVFDFDNLIDGNEQLSREILNTMNENSEKVFADFRNIIDESLGEIHKQFVNQIFSRVPVDELFLP